MGIVHGQVLDATVDELAMCERLEMARQSVVTQHLDVLVDANL